MFFTNPVKCIPLYSLQSSLLDYKIQDTHQESWDALALQDGWEVYALTLLSLESSVESEESIESVESPQPPVKCL